MWNKNLYSSQLAMALRTGKTPVFVYEISFSTESVRQFAYAPKGFAMGIKFQAIGIVL